MKYINIIKDYALRGTKLSPLEALRHITFLYMEQCGVSGSLRTVIYEAGEFWLQRLIDTSEEWKNKLVGDDEYLFHAMRHFHEEYALEQYERYDIIALSAEARKEVIDYMVSELCKEISENGNVVKPWNEQWLQAYCWGAYEYIKRFHYEEYNADDSRP